MSNRSKKHHYLPRYFLKGFTDTQGNLLIYDKRADSMFSSAPGGAFFENNLNTVELPNGGISDFLEGLYTAMESQFWAALDRIRSSGPSAPIELSDKMHLYLFLLFQHWRVPSNIETIEELSQGFFRGDNNVDFYTLKFKTGEKVPDDLLEQIRQSAAFKKTSRVIVPFAPFFKDKDWSSKLADWRFAYTGDGQDWYMVGDNPIITPGQYDRDPITCLNELVFPVSGRILLVSRTARADMTFSPDFVFQSNLASIQRAERFVACRRKDYFESVVDYYKRLVRQGKASTIVPELFEMLS